MLLPLATTPRWRSMPKRKLLCCRFGIREENIRRERDDLYPDRIRIPLLSISYSIFVTAVGG
jgi:hypothetical protein